MNMRILKTGKINLDGFGGISFIGWSVEGGTVNDFQLEAIKMCAPNWLVRWQMITCL